jgi:hypothetical protein
VPAQSRAGLDARYGRQGGRVVPWQPVDPRWKVGDRVVLADTVPGNRHPTTAARDPLTVVAITTLGRPVVRFPSGAELTVQPDHLESDTR